MERRVFISHSFSDEPWVREFSAALRKRGLQVWEDQHSIRPGESLREEIEKGLRESSLIVILFTPENVTQPNLFFEIGAAIGLGKPVVAVVSPDVDIARLPQPIRERKYLLRESPQTTADQLFRQAASL
jgi:nucleoside 2-deoxyribosyltransferase